MICQRDVRCGEGRQLRVIDERGRETEQGLLVASRLDIIQTDQGKMFKTVGMFTKQLMGEVTLQI